MGDIMSETVREALNNPATRSLVLDVYLARRRQPARPRPIVPESNKAEAKPKNEVPTDRK